MNITVPKKLLSDQLSLLERIVPSRSANPLYTYLGLYAEEGALILFGTNGEVDLEVRLPAEAQSLPRVLVPAQPFFQLVRSLPGDLVAHGLAAQPGRGRPLALAAGRGRSRPRLIRSSCRARWPGRRALRSARRRRSASPPSRRSPSRW